MDAAELADRLAFQLAAILRLDDFQIMDMRILLNKELAGALAACELEARLDEIAQFPELKHQGTPIVGMEYDHKLTVITTELFEQLVAYRDALAANEKRKK